MFIIMLAKIKYNILEVIPMSRYEYNKIHLNITHQHGENKWKHGYYCSWGDYKFWVTKEVFDDLFELDDDLLCK